MAKTYYLGPLKVTDERQFDRDEMVVEILDCLQKMEAEANKAATDPERTVAERLRAVEYTCTQFAGVSNCLMHNLGIEIRDSNGMLVTQEMFYRINSHRMMLSVELGQLEEGE